MCCLYTLNNMQKKAIMIAFELLRFNTNNHGKRNE